MKWNLRHLRVFLAVTRHSSVSRAAGECNLSQPAVTQAIAKLERGLGQPLFHHQAQGLFATPAGEQLAVLSAREESSLIVGALAVCRGAGRDRCPLVAGELAQGHVETVLVQADDDVLEDGGELWVERDVDQALQALWGKHELLLGEIVGCEVVEQLVLDGAVGKAQRQELRSREVGGDLTEDLGRQRVESGRPRSVPGMRELLPLGRASELVVRIEP